MLVQFSVSNYRSIKDEVVLNLSAASISEHEDHVFDAGKKYGRLLRCGAIYGANASGKSNLIRAMSFLRYFVMRSATKMQAGDPIMGISPFKLDAECENKPSVFEISFLIKGVFYRYGFSVTSLAVEKEWLYYTPDTERSREVMLFDRVGLEFQIGSHFKQARGLVEKARARDNALFLSVAAQFNVTLATEIILWFKYFHAMATTERMPFEEYTIRKLLEDEKLLPEITRFIANADPGIQEVKLRRYTIIPEKLPKNMPEDVKQKLIKDGDFEILFAHKKNGHSNDVTYFDLHEESEGTQKMFALSVPIMENLRNGEIVVLDEIETHLHPLLVQYILKLFHSPETNPKNAQLIFTTHNVGLLDKEFLRRDQIYFTEKDSNGATQLFSLVEYKNKPRNDASYAKDYMLGKYGAIPSFAEPKSLFGKNSGKKKT